jgi:NADP-dependent 3-hydroxy acid dehydrogenase YdfG
VIFPAAGFIDAALSAAKLSNYFNFGFLQIQNLNIQAPLSLNDHHDSKITVLVTPLKNEFHYEVRLDSEINENGKFHWLNHAIGTMTVMKDAPQEKIPLERIKIECPKVQDPKDYYQASKASGLDYLRHFQGLKTIFIGESQGLGLIDLSDQDDIHADILNHRYFSHPSTVDSSLQLVAAIHSSVVGHAEKEGVYLPIGFETITFYRDLPIIIWAHARLRNSGSHDLLQADISLCDQDGYVLAELIGYSAKYVKRDAFNKLLSKTNVIEDIYYELRWTPKKTASKASVLGKNWLLMNDLPELEIFLKNEGANIEKLNSGIPKEAYDHIVYSGDMNERFLQLIQNIILPTRLWVLKKADDFNKGALVGFIRSVQNEYPDLHATLIEYENSCDWLSMLADDNEGHLFFKNDERFVLRLEAVDLKVIDGDEPLFEENATYLITAGLSALGLELSKWLVEQGAKSLVLTKRNPPTEKQQLLLDWIAAQGTTLTLLTADVTQFEEIKNVIDTIQEKLPPLKGVFHTAGVVDDGVIQQQTWERFEKVFAPKMIGSLNLHELTKNLKLDYFVLYSSIVSVLGLAGQSNYAAANSFMDALIDQRRKEGLAGQSIHWGPWGEVGMAIRQQMSISGMHNLTIKKGMDALYEVLRTNIAQAIVCPMEWPAFLATYPNVPLMLAHFQKERQTKTRQNVAVYNLKLELQKSDLSNRQEVLENYLTRKIKTVLKLRENQPMEISKGFFEMGMDSLMVVDLKNQLQADIGEEKVLPQTLLFSYPNAKALVEYYENDVFSQFFEATPAFKKNDEEATLKETQEEVLKEVNKMSSEDIDRLLDEDL